MDNFYILKIPDKGPSPPQRYSFTMLKSWRECPRRWWLSNSSYSNVKTKHYPSIVGPAVIQGRIVHETLEEFSKHCRKYTDENLEIDKILQTFPIRKVMFEKMNGVVAKEVIENPRIKGGNLLSKILLDELIVLFKAILRAGSMTKSTGNRTSTNTSRRLPYGPEQWLEIDAPPICGQLDLVTENGIFEFKTGRPEPSHEEQLHFYSLLWYLSFGLLPASLKLIYGDAKNNREVQVPNIEELTTLKEEVLKFTTEISREISSGLVPALPTENKCSLCHVRQLCEDYWSAYENLQGNNLQTASTEDGAVFYQDVEFIFSTKDWQPEHQYIRGHSCFGNIVFYFDLKKISRSDFEIPRKARVLRAKLVFNKSEYKMYETRNTEIFWIY